MTSLLEHAITATEDSSLLSFSFPAPAGAAGRAGEPRAFLSLRASGDLRYRGPVASPRRAAFLRANGIAEGRVVGIELRHTRRVLFLESAPRGRERSAAETRDGLEEEGISPEDAARHPRCEGDGGPDGAAGVDGLVSRHPDDLPSVTVADCMPIWILDRGSGAFGVLHSGWKGTGILESAVRGLEKRHGSDPAKISVILGPCIGACCYRVPEERARRFAAEFGAASVRRGEGDPRLDLRLANVALARRLGIGALLSIDSCTACDERLGSFRREGPERFTRMLALCGRLEEG